MWLGKILHLCFTHFWGVSNQTVRVTKGSSNALLLEPPLPGLPALGTSWSCRPRPGQGGWGFKEEGGVLQPQDPEQRQRGTGNMWCTQGLPPDLVTLGREVWGLRWTWAGQMGSSQVMNSCFVNPIQNTGFYSIWEWEWMNIWHREVTGSGLHLRKIMLAV